MNLNDQVVVEVHQDWHNPDLCSESCRYFFRASGNEYSECRLFHASLRQTTDFKPIRYGMCKRLARNDVGTTGCLIDALQLRIAVLEVENKRLAKERDEACAEVARLTAECAELRAELRERTEAHEEAKTRIAALEAENKRLREERDEARAEVERVREQAGTDDQQAHAWRSVWAVCQGACGGKPGSGERLAVEYIEGLQSDVEQLTKDLDEARAESAKWEECWTAEVDHANRYMRERDEARAERDAIKPLGVNSIGTCAICGYTGPGPKHDCKPKPRIPPSDQMYTLAMARSERIKAGARNNDVDCDVAAGPCACGAWHKLERRTEPDDWTFVRRATRREPDDPPAEALRQAMVDEARAPAQYVRLDIHEREMRQALEQAAGRVCEKITVEDHQVSSNEMCNVLLGDEWICTRAANMATANFVERLKTTIRAAILGEGKE